MEKKMVFFGSSPYVLPILDWLQSHFTVSLVVTTEKNRHESIFSFSKQHNLPVLSVSNLRDETTLDTIKQQHADFSVLVSFGVIIPQKVISLFPKGIINIHPSLLPLYRGPTPVQSAIAKGERETGVSLMLLDPEVDHGPIIDQKKIIIAETDTNKTLHEKLFLVGITLLDKNVQNYLAGVILPQEQNHKKATYTTMLTRESGFIDYDNPPQYRQLERMIRAYYPWPGVWTKWNGKIVKLLPYKKIHIEGKTPTDYTDFINGYKEGRQFLETLQLV